MSGLSDLEAAMLHRLASLETGPHFRHQTRDEQPLTTNEKVCLATALLRRNPGEFLARFAHFLAWPADAECFRASWDDYTVRFYLQQAGVVLPPPTQTKAATETGAVSEIDDAQHRRMAMRRKNRRLVAMHRMEAEAAADPTEGFFSQERMRERDPQLWEGLVGRHLSEGDRRALLGHQYESFSGMLLSQLMESEAKGERCLTAYVGENADDGDSEAVEVEFDSDDENNRRPEPSRRQAAHKAQRAQERQRDLQEFTEIMQSRFLAGQDEEEFDYDAVDNDSSLDDEMLERDRDAEESYFDAESPASAVQMDNNNDDAITDTAVHKNESKDDTP